MLVVFFLFLHPDFLQRNGGNHVILAPQNFHQAAADAIHAPQKTEVRKHEEMNQVVSSFVHLILDELRMYILSSHFGLFT